MSCHSLVSDTESLVSRCLVSDTESLVSRCLVSDTKSLHCIHDVSAFTIGNTLTETWRGFRVMRSYSSIDKSNFLCVFDYILQAPKLTTF